MPAREYLTAVQTRRNSDVLQTYKTTHCVARPLCAARPKQPRLVMPVLLSAFSYSSSSSFCSTLTALHRMYCTAHLRKVHGDLFHVHTFNEESSACFCQSKLNCVCCCRMQHRCSSTAHPARPSFSEIHDALRVLDLGDDIDATTLKKRYRELVRAHHPDTGGSEMTMSRITVAYNRLASMRKSDWESYRHELHSMQSRYHHGRHARMSSAGYGATPQRYAHAFHQADGSSAENAGSDRRHSSSNSASAGGYANGAYARARAEQQEAYWSSLFYRNTRYHSVNNHSNSNSSSSSGSDGASYSNPFSTSHGCFASFFSTPSSGYGLYSNRHGSLARGLRFASPGVLILQGLVFYLLLCSAFLFLFRRWRDRREDDGWRMSESLARHEQMQELQRIRQELNERARAMAGEVYQARLGSSAALPRRQEVRSATTSGEEQVSTSADSEALAQARKVRLLEHTRSSFDVNANNAAAYHTSRGNSVTLDLHELRGWPALSAEQGRLYRRPQDPVGVVVYEPRRIDDRQRQVENARLSQLRGRRQDDSRAASTPPALAPRQAGDGTALPATPESNVSAITAVVVNNEEETRAAIESILQKAKTRASG